MQNESVPVDVLTEKIKQAFELIAICQTELTKTEVEINKITAQMEQKRVKE